MRSSLSISLLAALCSTPVLIQPVCAQADEEARFNEKQADQLHKFAREAFKKGFPRQARIHWLQAIKLYSPDHEDAHKALGHIKIGKSWAPKEGFDYPINDTGSGSDGQRLFTKLKALRKKLASGHKIRANRWSQAGRKDKADYHYRMVLRWVKDDKEAQEALEHKAVGDVTGTGLEQTLYERSKMIEKAVVEQTKVDYPVEVIEQTHPFLERAQVKHTTVKSEHFTLYSDLDTEVLKETLIWAERAIKILEKAYAGDPGVNADPRSWLTELAYFSSKDTYKQVLKANGNIVRDLAWKLEHTSTSSLVTQNAALRVGATGGRQTTFDAAVRAVAGSFANYSSVGLREGVGHTFVGMIFNNNRLFSVDLKRQQGTVASEEDREYTSPNFDVWKDLALEMAWKMTGGTAARELPLLQVATMTNEQRIKAWSFVDYMVRRDLGLLRAIDAMHTEKTVFDLEEKFNKQNKVTLAQLDKEWEDFWTGASPVMKAIKNNTPPLAAVSRGVAKYLSAFNEVRKAAGAVPVTWSANYSARCHDHAKYLKEHKIRDLGEVQAQNLDLEGATHLGNMFAQMALVETKASAGRAKKLFESWLDIPGYRDALVHNFLLSVGIYSEGSTLVINAVSGLGSPKRKKDAGYTCYPRNHRGIPAEVDADRLGPEFLAAVEAGGHKIGRSVGYPMTIHFGTNVQGDRRTYACRVSVRGEVQPGIIILDDGKNRRTTAPGMVTFVPLKPLPKGEVNVIWSWELDGQPRTLATKFTTK